MQMWACTVELNGKVTPEIAHFVERVEDIYLTWCGRSLTSQSKERGEWVPAYPSSHVACPACIKRQTDFLAQWGFQIVSSRIWR